jgi:hypothetical protein
MISPVPSCHVMSCPVISLLNSRYVDTEMLAADSIYCRRLIVAISSSCTLPLLLLLLPSLLLPYSLSNSPSYLSLLLCIIQFAHFLLSSPNISLPRPTPTAMHAAEVGPDVMRGKTLASPTRKLSTPSTFNSSSTTARQSLHSQSTPACSAEHFTVPAYRPVRIAHVPHAW